MCSLRLPRNTLPRFWYRLVIRIILSTAFAAVVLGALALFSAFQIQEEVSKLDKEWESVSLRNFVAGKHENKCMFRIRGYRAADCGVYYDPYGSIQAAYIPLFPPGREDEGQSIRVVVEVTGMATEDEIMDAIEAGDIPVQYHGGQVASEAQALSDDYPSIDWSKVTMVRYGDRLPSPSMAFWLFLTGGGLLILAIATGLFGVSVGTRSMRASKVDFDEQADMLESQPATISELSKSRVSQRLRKLGTICIQFAPVLIVFNVTMVMLMRATFVDETLGMWVLFATGPAFLLSAAAGVAIQFFVPPEFKIENRSAAEIPHIAMTLIQDEMQEFQDLGYQLLGYSQTDFMGTKYNAYLMKYGEPGLLEVTAQDGSASHLLIGVADNGMIFANGKTPGEMDVDGLPWGIPLVLRASPKRDPRDTIRMFQTFREFLQEQESDFLPLRSNDVFHVMHYEAILSGWWAYYKAIRFSKPERMPSSAEVVAQKETGENKFAFRRCADLDHAFDVQLAPQKNQMVNNPEYAGLMSAKFFAQTAE